jgi:hypothetical protein
LYYFCNAKLNSIGDKGVQQVFKKYSNIKFHENLSVGAELFRGDERIDREDITKQIATFSLLQMCLKVSVILLFGS